MPRHRRKARRIDTRLLVILCIVFSCTAIFAAVQLAVELNAYSSAGKEYENLRAAYAPEPAPPIIPAVLDESSETSVPVPEQVSVMGGTALTSAPIETPKPDPSEINPEYAGWLEIVGTAISYPIAQGQDNSKYLTTSFEGRENKLGAIFLDARCAEGFDAPHAILYGHNAKDGSMFGALADVLELDACSDIIITLPDSAALVYSIYDVRETDINDPAYRLDFADDTEFAAFAAEIGAPNDTARLLTLSTCTDSDGRDKRLLVLATMLQENTRGG